MKTAIVGYTGFVGNTLCQKTKFSDCYNRTNIEKIQGKEYNIVFCAGAPSAKWIANQNPQQDRKNIDRLQNNLQKVKAQK